MTSVPKGIEISPNGQYAYVTRTVNSVTQKAIVCIDLNTMNEVALPGITITAAQTFQYSMIESNGVQLFLAKADGLFRINNADNPAIANISNVLTFATNNQLNLSYVQQNVDAMPIQIPSLPNWEYNFGLYLLPDQMDFDLNCQIGCYSYTCGDNSSAESCCNFYSAFAPNSFHDIKVSNNAFWQPNGQINGVPFTGGTIKVGGNILIEPGVTLDIKDLRIEFSPTSKVIVSRGETSSSVGARLNLDKVILTTWENCGDCYMWRGIEAHGYNSLSQTTSSQAQVTMTNGTKIEYAHFGVIAGAISQGNWVDWSQYDYGGARITTNRTTFLNNKYDAFFIPYSSQNYSKFILTNFITDDNLKAEIVSTPIHANIWSNKGIQFRSCRFENETPILEQSGHRGIGIMANNSGFVVTSFGSTSPSQFNKLKFGVNTYASNSGLNYGIYSSQFNSNWYGIYSQGEQNSIIENNVFEVFNSEVFDTPLNETYGVQLRACNRYRVNNNLFKATTPVTKEVHTFGCVIDNSGPFTNVVEQNNFLDLHTGGVSRRQNAGLPGQKNTGLQWLCNSFSNDFENDLWVQSGGNINHLQGSVSFSQGLLQLTTAGNFFNTLNNPNIHFRMESDVPPIWYLHYQQNAPLVVSNNISIAHTFETRVCGRLIDLDPQNPDDDTRNLRLSLYQEKQIIDEMIDFGNTDSLMLEILEDYLTAEQKRDLLRQEGISISDDVMIKYMESNPSHQHLYQVLVYNSPLTDKVVHQMMQETDLPNGMKQQILLLQVGMSEYDAKQQVAQEYELNIRFLENKYFEAAMTDSTLVHPFDEIIAMYEESPVMTLDVMESLFNLYLATNNLQKSDSINVILKGMVNDPSYAYMNDLAVASLQTDYYTLLQDTSVVLMLENIAELYDYRDAGRAQALLSGYLGYKFEPIAVMGPRNMLIPKYTYDGSVLETISIFPNPAQDHFFIVFDENADVSQKREVKVYDLSGVLQFTREMNANDYVLEVKTENMAKGMYLVTISAEGKEISTQKVAVR